MQFPEYWHIKEPDNQSKVEIYLRKKIVLWKVDVMDVDPYGDEEDDYT